MFQEMRQGDSLELPSADNGEHGGENDSHIHEQIPVLKIIEVFVQSREHLLHGVGVAVIQGCLGGYSRLYLVKMYVAGVVQEYLVDEILPFRAISYERHLSPDDVYELGKLVQVMGAKPFPYGSQPFVVYIGYQLGVVSLRVLFHGSEFVDIERAASFTDTLLFEEGMASILFPD